MLQLGSVSSAIWPRMHSECEEGNGICVMYAMKVLPAHAIKLAFLACSCSRLERIFVPSGAACQWEKQKSAERTIKKDHHVHHANICHCLLQ